jgi:hypothetical protein
MTVVLLFSGYKVQMAKEPNPKELARLRRKMAKKR